MLVLSRKTGESIVIAGDIVVTVVELGRGRVQIGIEAPAHIPVYRNEIVERMIARGEISEMAAAAG
jgi:carbon storage regulator